MNLKRIKNIDKLDDDVVYTDIPSPVGELTLLASDKGLHMILWDNERQTEAAEKALSRFQKNNNQAIIQQTQKQFAEYFTQKRKIFEISLCIQGTAFQKQAWHALQQIPFGETISYGEQAKQLGDKNKARAVGMANGMNPISIIIPCHRVIGANGKLTGFAGGFDKKAFLLDLETSI
jgi:methylated-DNA-[protein]-cysteine S-methyltransferase